MALISLADFVRIRDYARPDAKGAWDFGAIFNKEIYPALNALRRLVIQIVDNVQPARITAPTVTADQNNYTTDGQDSAGWVRISGNADRTITGLLAADFALPFDQKTYVNVGAFTFFFPHEDSGSDPENRFANQGDLELAMLPGDVITFWYDATSQRVRPV